MHDWQFFSELRHLVQSDPGGRGLDRIPGRSLFSLTAPDLQAACQSLAILKRPEVAIVTGFYVARAECYETDGPLGAVFLAEVLHHLGAQVTLLAESGCTAAMEVALRLNGLEDHVRLDDLPAPNDADMETWVKSFWHTHTGLTHLVAIERVGPSHSLSSLILQYGEQAAPVGMFVQTVDPASWNRPYSMRGQDLSVFTSQAHRLFETRPASVTTIGIGDGGNEIGMGRIPWDVINANIPQGGKIACRIPTQHLIVSGTSNWGAYALAGGLVWLRQQTDLARLFDSQREAQLWEATLEKEPLVDGVTAECRLSVDGLDWKTYCQPMMAIEQLLDRGRSQEHGVSRFPSLHG